MPSPWTPPPVTPVPAGGGAQAEMVAVLANMAESALAAGPAPATEVSGGDPRRAEGDRRAPGPRGGRVCPPAGPGAGPRAHRVHAAPVRPGGAGRPAGLGRHCHRACQIFCVSWGSRCPFVTLLRVVSGVRVRRGHGRGT